MLVQSYKLTLFGKALVSSLLTLDTLGSTFNILLGYLILLALMTS